MVIGPPSGKGRDLGVSAVVAVILLTAITVVLSGFVFLWAASFTDQTGGHFDRTAFEIEVRDDPAGDIVRIMILRGETNWDLSRVVIVPEGENMIFGNLSSKHGKGTAGEEILITSFTDEWGTSAVLDLKKGDSVIVRIVKLETEAVQAQYDLTVQ
jgi:FlaG/FlaF family flagellin (archaellin)